MALNRVAKLVSGIKGRSMFNTANSKQTNPTRLSGSGIRQLGGTASGKESLGKSSPNSSRSRVPDTPGKGPLNAAGKGKGNDTTSLS